jgi:RNA polymerase sigma-70 factor (ECF subfamily)
VKRYGFLRLPQTGGLQRSCVVNARIVTASDDTAGGSEALDLIFRAHYERVARAIGRVIHDQARAEELAVDVFLKWWRHPAAHGDHAEGWIYRTAIRLALDELRRQRRRQRFERVFGWAASSPATPEHAYAAALNVNPTYVGSLLARAQEAFRKEYGKRHGQQS